VPSDLYEFQNRVTEAATIQVNGKVLPLNLEKGYAAVTRPWKRGDIVELNLPMPVRRIIANKQVEADTGKVALQRGPLVYCIEWPEVKEGHVVNLLLPDNEPLTTEFRPGLLGGIDLIRGKALSFAYTDAKRNIREEKVAFAAIPYYAWANRGRGEMAVWLARTESAARPLPFPTIASTSTATASADGVTPDVKALNDQREPKSSGDHSNRFLHWWPHKGTK
jgi:hypothetical protein